MISRLTWEREQLPNGLTVLFYPNPSALTAQLSVAIKYGSDSDLAEKAGNAHFLEHMLVGGSSERIELHHEVEKLGGCSYFETSPDCIFTGVNVLSGNLAESGKVLSELLFDRGFGKEKFEIERKVILNEIAEAEDDPQDKAAETLIQCLFKQHPLKNPVLGTRKTIRQLSLVDIEESHRQFFFPENMILVLTGNFSGNDAEAVLGNFRDREKGGFIRCSSAAIDMGKPTQEKVIRRSGINQAYLAFGLRTEPATGPNIPVLNLIDSILGMGESSRLFVELREKRAIAYDFASFNISGSDYGYLAITCAVKNNSLKQTRSIIQKELEKLQTQIVSKSEMEKSINMLIGDVYRSIDDSHALPRIMAEHELYFRSEKSLQTYIDELSRLSGREVMETASEYFDEENYATAIVIPRG